MALSAGTRLGPYEILAPLGAGGMGEVYRARDTRLDRTVAIKVLPAETAADPKLKARFEREARAISALAHPNICTLHDVGEQDGRFLAFVRMLSGTGDIWLYRFEDRQVLPFLTTQASEAYADFSPDGRWLAYASDESGQFEIYVTSFPDGKETHTVSRQGGTAPAWSRDGRRLFYYSGLPGPDGRHSMMAVSLRHEPVFSMGSPEALFRLPSQGTGFPMRSYALHPDGRYLLGRIEELEPIPPITRLNLVHNWFEELSRLAPTD